MSESGLGLRQLGRAPVASNDVDEAETPGAVLLGRAEDGEVGAVVDIPGARLLLGDAERGDDLIDILGDIGGEGGVRHVPDRPLVDEAVEGGRLPRTW